MSELLEFDPTSEDAANSPLSVMNSSYEVSAHAYPTPPLNVLYASSIDTEGELPASRRPGNRQISMTIEMVDPTGALLRALQAKCAKIAREGGTLKRTLGTGQVIVFDLLTSEQFDPSFDIAYYTGDLVVVSLVFGAKPYGRGAAVTLTSHTESTLPYLTFTETGITGDVPALGKLVLTEAQAVDQWFVMWGIESRNYSSSSDAALFYQAEGRTAMGSSAIAAGPTGASGSGSNVMRNTDLAASSYQAILSTQAISAGNHLAHIGDFQVWARVQAPTTNTGAVTLALEWAQGDLTKWTRNTAFAVDAVRNGSWALVPLGQVGLAKVVQGTQRWEGRIVAQASVSGDDIDIDALYIVPVTEGYGEARGVASTASPTTFLARDEFNQTAGNLGGKTLPTGGTWTTVAIAGGGTTDFTVDATNHRANRTATGGTWRGAHNATNYAAVAVQCDTHTTLGFFSPGVMARYVDTSNYLVAQVTPTSWGVSKVIGGTTILLGSGALTYQVGSWITTQLTVDAAGRWSVYTGLQGSALSLTGSGQDSVLATGGTLATGKAGLYDQGVTSSGGCDFDNFRAWTPASDAAMFASQSLEIRHDRVIRESSDGTSWQSATNYEGSYLRLPPAGAEGRSLRVFVKASRSDPYTDGADSAIDDLTGQLTYTPRFLVIP
jgi:hypothetical protein